MVKGDNNKNHLYSFKFTEKQAEKKPPQGGFLFRTNIEPIYK